ncbi:PcfB family protein [Oscillospiraceae bacterium OttesenSCG-928-G22]|nr:PcfB family protein [Oscillospiraceae bacterium OttesenSCG-928-G22]
MQEEIENRTVTLAISGTKLTGRVLKAAIAKYLAYRKSKKLEKAHTDVTPHGKQSVKELIGQNQGVSNIEINNSNIKDFERVARKYGVDFAVKKDKSVTPPKYLVFFKAKDADALTSAFREYTAKTVKKASRPSVLQKLQKFKDMVKNAVVNRTKRKEHER